MKAHCAKNTPRATYRPSAGLASVVLGLSCAVFFAASCAVSRSFEPNEDGGSETLDLGSATGQSPGLLDGTEPICIHSFRNGLYRISSPAAPGSTTCGVGMRTVQPLRVTYASNALKPWLEEIEPGGMIKLDMRYATEEIFPDGQGGWRITTPLYGQGRCFLHPTAKKRLLAAEAVLQRTNPELRLLVHDCYRPQYVSQTMWDLIRDPRWVAANGKSSHNKGGAVDLTLATLDNVTPVAVDMGSAFDLFSEKSKFSAGGLSAEQRAHRDTLRRVMVEAGWRPYDEEWWHFSIDVGNPHLDLPL